MSLREEQCNKICRILDDVLANRPTERDSLIVAVRKAFAEPQERKGKWIPDYTDCREEIWVEWKCSCCGFIRTTGWEHSGGEMPTAKFCEECGARMEVEHE